MYEQEEGRRKRHSDELRGAPIGSVNLVICPHPASFDPYCVWEEIYGHTLGVTWAQCLNMKGNLN